ncbi:MAG TPA: hypothetical protein VFE08_03625, partial [Candidatus Sulfotelmatobacter sp.]|nr:hypothetical protein [Candidatus Sulfotelmatobacter sp.]
SLALLGPGAFSIDARMFGRRILISSASSNPADGEQKCGDFGFARMAECKIANAAIEDSDK